MRGAEAGRAGSSGSRTRCSRSGASRPRDAAARARGVERARGRGRRSGSWRRRRGLAHERPGRARVRVVGEAVEPAERLRRLKNARRNLSGFRLRFGPSLGLPIGSSSPNRIGSPPDAAALQPAHRRADQSRGRGAAPPGGRPSSTAGRGGRGGSARSRSSRRRRPGSARAAASAKRPNSRALGRVTPARSPRVGVAQPGAGRREREHHLEAARLGVGEHLRRSAPSRGTAPGRCRRSRAACVRPPGATAAQFSCTLIMSTPRRADLVERRRRGCSPFSTRSVSSWKSANWRALAPAAAGSSARAMRTGGCERGEAHSFEAESRVPHCNTRQARGCGRCPC